MKKIEVQFSLEELEIINQALGTVISDYETPDHPCFKEMELQVKIDELITMEEGQ